MMSAKSILKSKTLWANLAFVGAGVLFYIQGELAVGSALTLTGLSNAVLRYVTKAPVKWGL